MSEDKKIRVGLVGCGRITKKHISVINELDDYELVAVCDVIKERADKYADEFNTKAYYDYEEMLKEGNIDLVDICTPSGMHPEMTIKAADAKKHIVCEKPMALKLKDADEMINACQDNKVRLFVIKQNRLNPPVVKVKEALDQGRFGKLFLLNVTVRWHRPQEYYDQDEWKGTIDMDGGVLMNQASHHVDLIQWFGGPVKSVFAKKKTFNHDIEAEDTAIVIIEFESGALGLVEATTCTYPENLEGSLTILGEKGSAKVGGFAVNKMETWKFEDKKPEDTNILASSTNPPDVYGFSHLEYFKNVAGVLKRKEQAFTDGKAGRKSLEIIEAIHKSVAEKREIDLPLK